MNKPIIIDGVDVSECMYFDDAMCQAEKRSDGNTITECFGFTCYFKRLQRLKAENEKLRQYKQSKQASYEAMQNEWNKAINELKDIKAENENLKSKQLSKNGFICDCEKLDKYKQALEEVREIAKLIKEDDDKPACVYDEGCPLNGGAGFDNHCNMTCPYVLAKIIDDKINEVLKDEQ